MLFSRYKFLVKEPGRYFFVGAGAGLSHVTQRVKTNQTKRVARDNFAVALEAGVVKKNATIGLRLTSPVTTPTFEEVNDANGRTVVYSEANLTPLMLYAKYDILRLWKKN